MLILGIAIGYVAHRFLGEKIEAVVVSLYQKVHDFLKGNEPPVKGL